MRHYSASGLRVRGSHPTRLPMRQLVALLVLLVASTLAAPAADAQFRRDKRFARQGDVALVVGISGLDALQLRPVLSGIGMRYRVADQTVIGLSVGGSIRDAENESSREDPEGEVIRESTETGTLTTATFSIWMEQHLGRRNRSVSPFVGGGLQLSVVDSEFDSESVLQLSCQTVVPCPLIVERNETLETARAVSGGLAIGAEVRVIRGVTLGGAYTVSGTYRESDRTTRQTTKRDDQDTEVEDQSSEQSRFEFGTGVSQLNLSIYF